MGRNRRNYPVCCDKNVNKERCENTRHHLKTGGLVKRDKVGQEVQVGQEG